MPHRRQMPDEMDAKNQMASGNRRLRPGMDMSIIYIGNGVQPLLALGLLVCVAEKIAWRIKNAECA